MQLTDGRALVRPLSLKVAGGTVSGEAALNGREAVPSADVDLTFENLDLKPFFEGTQFIRETGRPVSLVTPMFLVSATRSPR